MSKEKITTSRTITSQMVIGAVVILVGVFLLLGQFHIIPVGNLFQLFPLVFIGMGIWQLVQNQFRHVTGPLMMIAIMAILQLSILGVVDGSFFWRLWPVLLIVAGGSIFLRQRAGGGDVTSRVDSANSADSFDIFTMFAGTERQMTSQSFTGGSITTLFGGTEVDLHHIQVENRPAVINIFCMFGGIGLKASPDTIIDSRVVAIFGAASDERQQRKMVAGESSEVIVKGFVLFGGVGIEE